ncbi:MAG: glycosyltransferase family 4 protein [Promethearchaeota archaeon]
MSICYVTPRFHPVIGGVETYLKNIAEYCSLHFDTIVITSNLKNMPQNLFEKSFFIEKKYDLLTKNIEIIRANTLNRFIIKSLFYLNQYINKKVEIFFDKLLNPNLYPKKANYIINKDLSELLLNCFIYQRSFFNPYFSQIYYILKKVHKKQKINIIHSSPIYLTATIYAYRFSKKEKIPFFCTPLYHINPYADYILYPSFQHILRNTDAIIACTSIEKNLYLKYGINEKKIHIIPPGINPENYKNINIERFKKKYKIPENAQLILFMGRKSYEKGVINSILALKYIIKSNKNIKLIIAGPSTREYKIFFKKLPSKLKEHIIDIGIVNQDTKANAFASCDVFILPSLDDAFGIVFLEAWLFKKPVIGALKGNIEGLIDDKTDGFLIPFNDVKSLALKIKELLTDKTKSRLFGQNGYKKVIDYYLLEKTNNKILNLYNRFT